MYQRYWMFYIFIRFFLQFHIKSFCCHTANPDFQTIPSLWEFHIAQYWNINGLESIVFNEDLVVVITVISNRGISFKMFNNFQYCPLMTAEIQFKRIS